MDGIPAIFIVIVFSLIGTLVKQAQTAQRKKAAQQTTARADTGKKAPPKQTAAPVFTPVERREVIRPFGGSLAQPSMPVPDAPAPMQLFGEEAPDAHRVKRMETLEKERAAGEEAAPISLQFSKDALLQGIILSEVLKRPQPGSFRRLPANR